MNKMVWPKVDKYIARLLMVSFFLTMQLQVVAVVVGCLYFVIRSFQDKDVIQITNVGKAFLLGAVYLLYVGAVFFTPERYSHELHQHLEHRLSFILFPVLFALISKQKIESIKQELLYFTYACFFVCLAANAAFTAAFVTKSPFFEQFSMPHGGFGRFSHVDYRIFFEVFQGYQPTYMSIMLVFSIAILMVAGKQMNRVLKYGLFYMLLFFLVALVAKSPILALVFIFIHFAWLNRTRMVQYKWLIAGMLLLVTLSYCFVPFVSQRVNEMFQVKAVSQNGDFGNNSLNERKMIWNVDIGLVKHYWLTGVGPARLMHSLKLRYFYYSLFYGRNVGVYDPHNEYFLQWISFGLLGIITFLSVLIAQFIRAIKAHNYLYLYLLLILCTTFFTESVLNRQHGIIFYAFFSGLFFFGVRKRDEKIV